MNLEIGDCAIVQLVAVQLPGSDMNIPPRLYKTPNVINNERLRRLRKGAHDHENRRLSDTDLLTPRPRTSATHYNLVSTSQVARADDGRRLY